MSSTKLRISLLASTLLAGVFAGHALAQDAQPQQDTTDVTDKDVQTVIIRAERSKAAANAPSKASLDQGEPSSIVSRPFIENSIPETADYTSIANVTPSMTSAGSNNGPGFGESKVGLRGFSDGDYNVTMDGIPWGDTNNPTHHSNSFFPASTIGAVIVDRGPGSVADLGQANYGGNIKMFSNKVTDDFGVTLRETIGTWNSWQSVAVVQSGKLKALNNLAGFVNLQMNGSDGAQTNSSMHSFNATTKWVLPVSETWNLTFFGMVNANKWHKTDKTFANQAQINLYGKDFALSDDPTLSSYKGYNLFNKHTTFAYVKAAGDLPWGFKADSTFYNIYYDNTTNTAKDTTSGVSGADTPNSRGTFVTNAASLNGANVSGAPSNPTGIQAYEKLNHYMTWGNMTRLTREFSVGTLHAGLWMEIAATNRHTYDYDAQLGYGNWDHREKKVCISYTVTEPKTCTGYSLDNSLNYKSYEERSGWWQSQSYVDFAWKITDDLTFTPGVKYVSMKRTVNAEVIKSPRQSQVGSNKNSRLLTNMNVNYKLAHNWSVYAQYAEGMYLADLNSLYVINPAANQNDPQLSTNYQLGTVYQAAKWAIDADLYSIDLTNILEATADNETFINVGKAKASGIEGQVSYAFDNGITLFANGSSNTYVSKDHRNAATYGMQLKGAPLSTLGFGTLYHRGPWAASLLYKQVGKAYNDATETTFIDPFETVDVSVNYDFGKYRIKAQVNNLFDNRAVTSITPNANPLLSQYTFLAGQNAQLTLIAKF